MAIVRNFQIADAVSGRAHSEANANIRLVDVGGEKFIQIDTYGSSDRQEIGKLSQSVRLSKNAFDQLVQLGNDHF